MNNNYIKKVEEFMTTFQQPIVDMPAVMELDRNKLRIALIFEELKEYSEASGLLNFFAGLCKDEQEQFFVDSETEYNPVYNITEQFDALLDLQYVLSGTIIENGFKDIFDIGFNEIHRSNMSKACNNLEEAEHTVNLYTEDNQKVFYEYNKNIDKYLIKRCSDNKILKSINYSPANLNSILNIDTKGEYL